MGARCDRIIHVKYCQLRNVMLHIKEATWSYQGLHSFGTANSAEGGWKKPSPTGQPIAYKRLPKSPCRLLQENSCPLVGGSEGWKIQGVLCSGHGHISLRVVLPANRLADLLQIFQDRLADLLHCKDCNWTGLERTPASSHGSFWPSSDPSWSGQA
jgi:hypothetical protein